MLSFHRASSSPPMCSKEIFKRGCLHNFGNCEPQRLHLLRNGQWCIQELHSGDGNNSTLGTSGFPRKNVIALECRERAVWKEAEVTGIEDIVRRSLQHSRQPERCTLIISAEQPLGGAPTTLTYRSGSLPCPVSMPSSLPPPVMETARLPQAWKTTCIPWPHRLDLLEHRN